MSPCVTPVEIGDGAQALGAEIDANLAPTPGASRLETMARGVKADEQTKLGDLWEAVRAGVLHVQ